jgi:hypothetical protein
MRAIPSKRRKNFFAGVAACGRYRTNKNGSPASRRTVACDEMRRSREDEGAISDCLHRNVNPATALANRVRVTSTE